MIPVPFYVYVVMCTSPRYAGMILLSQNRQLPHTPSPRYAGMIPMTG